MSAMVELGAPDYQFARLIIERGLALTYAAAFLVALRQFPALCGDRGLISAPRLLAATSFWQVPSIFHIKYSDSVLRLVAALGVVLSVALMLGWPQQVSLPATMATWFVLWVLYQSIVNIGGIFYGFGWESLLLEAGFLAIFLGDAATAPAWPVILAFRWLAFRLEFGAGLIKLRGDRCWRELTCMDWHHETQPLPNPLSWFFHRLPHALHRYEVIGNFGAQLVLPFGLFLPQPLCSIAAGLMIVTQLYLIVSGNYAWLNWLTVVILCAGFSDSVLGVIPPDSVLLAEVPSWFERTVLAVSALIVVLSVWPVRNMLSKHQAMNASFNPLHLVNTYGAFGTVGRKRYEVILEGTLERDPDRASEWREYEFPGKPGDVRRMPAQFAPYHLRLDWLMWFLPLSPRYADRWFLALLERLLENDPAILKLLARNPFPDRPPNWIRASLYEYRFTTWDERRTTGAWWKRQFVAPFMEPVRR